MAEWAMPDRSRSRAVLLGTSKYSELVGIPAAANSLARMHRLLTGPLCGWPDSQVTVLANQPTPGDLPDQLIDWYSEATDVALFYYVGHGQTDDEDELCLGLTGSRVLAERRASTSLTFHAVRKALRASPASVKIVILDCCFAGQAVYGTRTLAGQPADITSLTSASGAYTLAAAGPYSAAWSEEQPETPVPHTYFTKYFAELVERGIPGEPPGLSLDLIYRHVRQILDCEGKPVPVRGSRDLVDSFIFARNAAPRPVSMPPRDQEPAAPAAEAVDLTRWHRLLDDAEKSAAAVGDPNGQAAALTSIARTAASHDPDRARRLLDSAERVASAIAGLGEKAGALAAISQLVAGHDLGRARQLLACAEEAATAIDDTYAAFYALVKVAYAAITYDPVLSRNALDHAGQLAVTLDQDQRDNARLTLAIAWIAVDPAAAIRVARSIAREAMQGSAFNAIIDAVLTRDPDHAERIARSISDIGTQEGGLARIAEEVTPHDPGRAERIARSMTVPGTKAEVLARLARDLTSIDPDRAMSLLKEAEQIARGCLDNTALAVVARIAAPTDAWRGRQISMVISDPGMRARTLANLAQIVLNTDPGEAASFILRARSAARESDDPDWHLSIVAKAAIAVDIDHALQIAYRVDDLLMRSGVFTDICGRMAKDDPERAETVAWNICELDKRAAALVDIARSKYDRDPEDANWLINAALRIARAAAKDEVIYTVVIQIATYDVGTAERITAERLAHAPGYLQMIAAKIAAQDIDAAERIAGTITDPRHHAEALIAISERVLNTGE
jgi:hypothetical protein